MFGLEAREKARTPGAVAGCVREFPGVEINTDGAGRIM